MVQRSRNIEVSFAKEVTPGATVTLTSGDVGLLVSDASVTNTQNEVERQPAGGSFSRRPPFAGLQTAQAAFSFPIAGPESGTIATIPAWSLLLQAAGFREVSLKKINIADTSSSFATGEVMKNGQTFVASGTSSATGRIIRSVWKGQGITTIYYEPLTGVVDTLDVLLTIDATDNRFDATITIAAQVPADGGTAWVPVSSEELSIDYITHTGDIDAGDLLRGATSGATLLVLEDVSGATGTLKYRACHRDPVNGEVLNNLSQVGAMTADSAPSQTQWPTLTIGVNEDGLLKRVGGAICETIEFVNQSGAATICRVTFQGTAETPIDQLQFNTGVDPLAIAPRYLSATLAAADYTDDDWALAVQWDPALANLTFSSASSPAQREDATTATGLKQFLGADKVISGTMDPEQLPEAVFSHYTNAAAKTPFRFLTSWGTAGTAPANSFSIAADEMMFNTLNSTDRNGLFVLDGQFSLYGQNEDEFVLMLI